MDKLQDLYREGLGRLAGLCFARARLVVGVSVVSALACAGLAAARLSIDSDQSGLINPALPFEQNANRLRAAFPQFEQTILAVVTGRDNWRVEQAAEQITAALAARPDLFKSVFYPQGDAFFRRNGLLYLDEAALDAFVDSLIEAQPAIAILDRDPSLRGLSELLSAGLEGQAQGGLGEALEPALLRTGETLEAFLDGRAIPDPWSEAFPEWPDPQGLSAGFSDPLRVIVVQPRLDYEAFLSAQKSISGLRRIAADLELEGIELRLTGREPLTYDEFRSVRSNIQIAGAVSASAIILALLLGTGSLALTLAIMTTLGVGLAWSLAWALASVGELNLISATFVILVMGIGVDFSIHAALRFREELAGCGGDTARALQAAVRGGGGALSLCALASAVGFLSFTPTDYYALSDLGLIAGGSMFLMLLAAFTTLPALLSLLPGGGRRRPGSALIGRISSALYDVIRRHCRVIVLAALTLGSLAIPAALQTRFDYSALSIKDPASESVVSLKELQKRTVYTDYTISSLAGDREEARARAQVLAARPTVKRSETWSDYVPANQLRKIESLEEAGFLLFPAFADEAAAEPVTGVSLTAALAELRDELAGHDSPGGRYLSAQIERLLARGDAAQAAARFNAQLTEGVGERFVRLRESLSPSAFEFDDLPAALRARIEAEDGRVRVNAYPAADIADPKELTRFVLDVTGADPQATGRPVVEHGAGQIVVESFQAALILAGVLISLLLLLLLRSVVNVILILLPIILAGSFALATFSLIDLTFNFGNVIVLPLLLGLGVANGIHMLARARHEGTIREVMRSSTPVAVFLSNLTTLATFGSLSIASHQGLRSMGLALAIAMAYMLLTALIVLPAFLAWQRQWGLRRAAARG